MISNHPETTDDAQTPRGQKPGRTLTTGQIAAYCRVNYRTVLRWIKADRLPAHQLPGRGDHRVEASDFVAFLRRHRMPVPIEFLKRSNQVLIVDDDPQMASSIRRVLKRAGFQTQVAPNGFQAGAMLGSFEPRLVVLDLKMPGIGGLDVLRFIREQASYHDVKVLIVSGQSDAELVAAVEAGADDALAKPFASDALVEKVRRLTDGPLLGKAG